GGAELAPGGRKPDGQVGAAAGIVCVSCRGSAARREGVHSAAGREARGEEATRARACGGEQARTGEGRGGEARTAEARGREADTGEGRRGGCRRPLLGAG